MTAEFEASRPPESFNRALEYLHREDGLGCPDLPPSDPDYIEEPYAALAERCRSTFKRRVPLVGIDLI